MSATPTPSSPPPDPRDWPDGDWPCRCTDCQSPFRGRKDHLVCRACAEATQAAGAGRQERQEGGVGGAGGTPLVTGPGPMAVPGAGGW